MWGEQTVRGRKYIIVQVVTGAMIKKKMKQVKMIWKCSQEWGGSVAILNKLARASPTEEMAFEQRPEPGERTSNANVWGRSVTDGRNSRCKGPEAAYWARLRNREETGAVGAD